MALPADFITSLQFIHPGDLARLLIERAPPGRGISFELRNEIRPVDLYCYLGGRFGEPNGIQNFLRGNHSANLIHWEWTLCHASGLISFQGMNYRTEVHIGGEGTWEPADRDGLIAQIKNDFSANGVQMSQVRRALENWIEFVNPYQRIRRSIDRLLEELETLKLRPETEVPEHPWDVRGLRDSKNWEPVALRYSHGFGLCFGIRSTLPVLAEAFVNLVLYILMKSEIKSDSRLRENVFRQPIDVRIKSLSIYCNGFRQKPDYSHEACSRYHSLVNERNDLLHGNVVIDKLKFNEVYFLGTVPVFREYRSIWERSLGVEMKAVGLEGVREDLQTVETFIEYILSCLEEGIRKEVEFLINRYELGLNTKTQRLGVLFAEHLVDFDCSGSPIEDSTGRPKEK
jgi:hypothetical protein